MMIIGKITAALLLSTLVWMPPAAAQGNAEHGRELGFTCLGCHGIEGQRNAYPSFRVPRLGGQSRDYMKAALLAYRDGSRPHPTMQAHANSLTDDDIEDLLAWLASFGDAYDTATAEAVAGLDAAARCVTCHGKDTENMVPAPPTLAGQHVDYLVRALTQYKDGERPGNVMTAYAAGLSDAEIATIARFYASQDGLETLSSQ